MRIERKESRFIELTLKESIRIPKTDIILEKGEKVKIPFSEKLGESKSFKESSARFEVSPKDAGKASGLVNDMKLWTVTKDGATTYVTNDERAYEELKDLFDSYNIEYEIRFGG